MTHRDVTVCIFAYNEEQTIVQAIRSALAQTAASRIAAILVGANGCTDDTAARAQTVADEDPRVRVVTVDERSKANMWNEFRARIGTRYAVFMDGDVEATPNAVGALVGALEANPALVFASAVWREIVPVRTWLTAIVDVPSAPPVSLPGRLYAADMPNVARVFERARFDRMPPSIIHEDLFLTCLVTHAEWCSVDAAVCEHPAPTMRDRLGREVRSFAARFQLEEEYPQFRARFAEMDLLLAGSRQRLSRFRQLPAFDKLLVLATYPFKRVGFAAATAWARRRGRVFYDSGAYRDRWIRVESEKVPVRREA